MAPIIRLLWSAKHQARPDREFLLAVEDEETGDNDPEDDMATSLQEVAVQQTAEQTVMQANRQTSPVSKRTRRGGSGRDTEGTTKLAIL
eukprot:gene41475-65561_t